MNCERCLKYDLCSAKDLLLLKQSGLELVENVEEVCPYFDNCAEYLHLPCEVGATVYILNHKGPIYANPVFNGPVWKLEVTGFHYSSIGKKKGYYLLCGCGFGGTERINFDRIGKDVFFDEDTAESVLRKSESKQ